MLSFLKRRSADPRKTESRFPVNLDQVPTSLSITLQILSHTYAAIAVLPATIKLSHAVKHAAELLKKHPEGRLIYVGAGTSGRLGTQDGVELIPTFRWSDERLAFLMAGGKEAFMRAVEGAEDSREGAQRDIENLNISNGDVVIGIAASGTTPYTCEALKEARERGALTIAMANNKQSPLTKIAEYGFDLPVGAEPVAGSTRMKSGTSQKVFLNTLSTQIMIELGKVFNGRMVDMMATNDKLVARAKHMIMDLTKITDPKIVSDALEQTGFHVKPAILIALGMTKDEAYAALHANDNQLRPIIRTMAPHLA